MIKCYQKNEEKLRKEAREWYQNLSEEKKWGKKTRDRYKNLSEEQKEKKCPIRHETL